jgi:hypothetical protein
MDDFLHGIVSERGCKVQRGIGAVPELDRGSVARSQRFNPVSSPLTFGCLQAESDVGFEDELSRTPYNLKTWWQYIHSQPPEKKKVRNRAL